MQKIRALINPKSGLGSSTEFLIRSLQDAWDSKTCDLTFQYSTSKEDGQLKVRHALEAGVDTILVVGGDCMVNSIGTELIDTGVALGVIPAGSGNGFARHFDIPLEPAEAARVLATSERKQVDVGLANGMPFFVTCSLAWDATIVRTFEKFPVRGILPYVLAGAYELLEYRPKPFQVMIDGVSERFENPLVFTVANLTQYGGGLRIAPQARADDGRMELVVINQKDIHQVLPGINKLLTGKLHTAQGVITRPFQKLSIRREDAGPMQLDGELIQAPKEVVITVKPGALTGLAPAPSLRYRALRALKINRWKL